MNYAKRIVYAVLIGIFCLGIVGYSGCSNHDIRYNKEQLETMKAEDLFKVFKENGLKVDSHLKEVLTEKELAKYVKEDFDLLIQGSTSRSDEAYTKLAKEIKEIYEQAFGDS